MTTIRRLAFLALLAVSMAIPACAGPFDHCVKSELGKITWTGTAKELGVVVENFLLCEPTSEAEVPMCAVAGLQALEQALGPEGRQIVNCIIAYYETGGGTQQLRQRAKMMAVRRGIHASVLKCEGFQIAERGGAAGLVRPGVAGNEQPSRAADPREGGHAGTAASSIGAAPVLGDSASPGEPAPAVRQ